MTSVSILHRLRFVGGLALALSAPLLLDGCASSSPGGFSDGLTDRDRETAQIATFERDVETIWARTKETLAHLSARVPRFDDETHQAYATVDDGSVRVEVIETTPGHSQIYSKARKFGLNNDELARSVLARIGKEIDR
jgi:hypothetical protein